MPKLQKIETDSNVSNYTPDSSHITTFFAEENGNTVLKYKDSTGTIHTLSGGGGGGGGQNFYKCASVIPAQSEHIDVTNNDCWTGYKAIQDTETGVWSFESSLTSDALTYSSVVPIVDGIYNADATATVSLYQGYPVISTPVEPTSNTFGDWIISGTGEISSTRARYKAFTADCANNESWESNDGDAPWTLVWRNTATRVLIKSYKLQQRTHLDGQTTTWILQGSDDGNTWTDIDSVTLQDALLPSQGETIREYLNNSTPYFYHRLYITTRDSSYTSGTACIGYFVAKSTPTLD